MQHAICGLNRRFIYRYIIVMVALLLSGCGNRVSDCRQVVVSIPPQKFILEQIVGDKMRVTSLLDAGSNPENYEPGMTQFLDLEKSMAYFAIGNIAFENALLAKARENNPGLRIIDSMAGVELLEGTHGGCGSRHRHGAHDGEENSVDPHTWSSVKNMKKMAENMYEAVSAIDPVNKEYYRLRYIALENRLDSIDKSVSSRLTPLAGRAFVVWHPSLSYLARDYGLIQIAVGREDKEATAIELKKRIDEAVSRKASIFFIQKEFDSRQAQSINGQLRTEMVSINPMSEDWESELNTVINALADV